MKRSNHLGQLILSFCSTVSLLCTLKACRTRSNFSQQFSAILEIEFDLVAKLVAKRSCREVAMCANVCNFRLSNFEQNEPLQLLFLCDFMLKVAVDSDQACLICATISLAIL